MSTPLFINLPVADLPRSLDFFEALGFSRNPQFSDGSGACFAVSEAVSVMLLTHARFRDFTPKAVCDTSRAVEVLLSLACESREQVDALVAAVRDCADSLSLTLSPSVGDEGIAGRPNV